MTNLFFLSAKCVRTRDPFYPRYDLAADGAWALTYGVKELPAGQKAVGGSGGVDLSNRRTGPQYKCPWCGNPTFFKCGNCGELTCYNGESKDVVCAYCSRASQIGGVISDDEMGKMVKVKGSGQ